MSATPRTDAMLASIGSAGNDSRFAKFAKSLELEITAYEECAEDVRRICREIDATMFGKDAAPQPSLCDIQASINKLLRDKAAP